jgi:hypothetical protein
MPWVRARGVLVVVFVRCLRFLRARFCRFLLVVWALLVLRVLRVITVLVLAGRRRVSRRVGRRWLLLAVAVVSEISRAKFILLRVAAMVVPT